MEVTRDPFSVLSPASMEPVIQHLTVKEVLEMSEVSKGWYEKTAQVELFLRRLKVDVKCSCDVNKENGDDNSELTKQTALVILQSRRKLHTLEVQLCCRCLASVGDLFIDAKHKQEWRCVTITHSQFELMPWLVMYLVSIQEGVERMTLRHITMSEEDDTEIDGSWDFPKLKVLNIVNCHSQTLQFIFKNCKNLEEFNFIDGLLPPDSLQMDSLIRVLQRNKALHTLTIGGNVFFPLMTRFRGCHLFKTFKFRVKKFTASSFYWPKETWRYEIFAEFVRSQSDSLLSIEFSRFMGFPVICAAFDCPRLIELTLKAELTFKDADEWRHYVLRRNTSIRKLTMAIEPTDFDTGLCQDVLAAAPYVKHLNIAWMNDNLLAHLSAVIPRLEGISIGELNLSTDTIVNRDPLPKLKSLRIDKSLTRFTELNQSRRRKRRTNFQMLFFKYFCNLCIQANDISEVEGGNYKNIMKILNLFE